MSDNRTIEELDAIEAEIAFLRRALADERRDSARLRKALAVAPAVATLDAWVAEGKEGKSWEMVRTGGRWTCMLREYANPVHRENASTADGAREAMAHVIRNQK